MQDPASMISAYKNVAQICGYYRQEPVKAVVGEDGQVELRRLNGLSDAELVKMATAGRAG